MPTTEAIRPENLQLAEDIINQIKAGVANWEMPWHQGIQEAMNPVTHQLYTGYNATVLWQAARQRNFKSNQWATLRQWRKIKGMVRRGAKGVALYRPLTHKKMVEGKIREYIYAYKRYHVFNDEEINNVNLAHPSLFDDIKPDSLQFIAISEHVADSSGAIIKHGETKAYYSPAFDFIGMPEFHSFFPTNFANRSENYYATLMHELIHWTKGIGRTPRQDNFNEHQFDYAHEELVAELGASILCTRLNGLVAPREDHAAYIQSWLAVLENDFEYFYQAMQLAQKAADWLCNKAGLQLELDGYSKKPPRCVPTCS